tara:strand:- start:77 stop:844 length:768 start_codon:yes stop_codon:yes gene_type:complete
MELDIRPVNVTALFDIERDKWDAYAMSYDRYIDWMERTLSIQAPTVVFTEEKFKDLIWEKRKPYHTLTEFVIEQKETLLSSQFHWNGLTLLMSSEDFINNKKQFDVPEMTKPWYNIMMFNKLWWLLKASRKIDGTHYIWTDAACYRDEVSKWNKPFPTDKFKDKPVFFSHHEKVSILNHESHCLSQMRFIQGGSFIIPKNKIEYLAMKFYKKVNECIGKGYIGSDEKIFDLLYDDGEDFDLIKCDWREYFQAMSR